MLMLFVSLRHALPIRLSGCHHVARAGTVCLCATALPGFQNLLHVCSMISGGQNEAIAAHEEAMHAVFTLQLKCHRHEQPHRARKDGRTKWAMLEMWPMFVSCSCSAPETLLLLTNKNLLFAALDATFSLSTLIYCS